MKTGIKIALFLGVIFLGFKILSVALWLLSQPDDLVMGSGVVLLLTLLALVIGLIIRMWKKFVFYEENIDE